MAFLILDQIHPSGNPTVLFHEQRRFCRAQTSDVHLVRTFTAWCPFPGSCWKLLEAWLVHSMPFPCRVDAGWLEELGKEMELHPCWPPQRLAGCMHTLHHPFR